MLTSGVRPDDAADLRALGIPQHLLKPVKQSEIYNLVVTSLSAIGVAAPAAPIHQVSPDAIQSLSGLRVLLAEDNVVNQKLALGILGKLGHETTIANNGCEALEKIQRQQFDLVLMDVQMPEMDGLAATRELRRRESGGDKRLPVIAMTAHAMKGDRDRCIAAGMDDYLSKPIRLKDLSEKLAALFGDRLGGAPERVTGLTVRDLDSDYLQEALSIVNGDKELLRELIDVFLDDVPRLLKIASEAADRRDSSALRATAHSIKGSMLFLNPRSAIEVAQALEQVAATGNIDASNALLTQLREQIAAIEIWLRTTVVPGT
jgi:CheY-like chemotaxis protein